MEKDFNAWTKKKIGIHNASKRVFFHEREVWWCSLGVNIGFEQDGKGDHFERPVLVFKKFNKEIFWALALTTKRKEGPYYKEIVLHDNIFRMAILSQIRLVDASRLREKIGTVSKASFNETKNAVINLITSPHS